MPRVEKLLKFLAALMMRDFYGTVTIRFEASKVTHVESLVRRKWQYKNLPDEPDQQPPYGNQV